MSDILACPVCQRPPTLRAWSVDTFPRATRQQAVYGCRNHGHTVTAPSYEAPTQVALTDTSLAIGAAEKWNAMVGLLGVLDHVAFAPSHCERCGGRTFAEVADGGHRCIECKHVYGRPNDEETTLYEVVHRIREGTFYQDYDWASGPALRVLRELIDPTPVEIDHIAQAIHRDSFSDHNWESLDETSRDRFRGYARSARGVLCPGDPA